MTPPVPVGLLDTSIFIAQEIGRDLDVSRLPTEQEVSVVTLAELEAGVLAAQNAFDRNRRRATLDRVTRQDPLLIDAAVASRWADLRTHLAQTNRRIPVNDLWIAATAVAHRIPLVTQGDGFDALDGVAGLEIIRI